MNSAEIVNSITNLQNTVANLRRSQQDINQKAGELEKEASNLKNLFLSVSVDALRQARGLNEGVLTTDAAHNQYQKQQAEKMQEAQNLRQEVQQLENKIKSCESINAELKKLQGFMQNLEIKAQTWVSQANEAMR